MTTLQRRQKSRMFRHRKKLDWRHAPEKKGGRRVWWKWITSWSFTVPIPSM